MDFILELFDTSDWPARWHCGRWTDLHGWLHILSDLAIWAAYFAIPIVLGYFLVRRKDLPFRSIFLLFGAFIVLCGTTHLIEAAIFWWPAYRFAGVMKLTTALVSWATVVALVRTAPFILSMRSADELERLVERRTTEKDAALASLRAERELQRLQEEELRHLAAKLSEGNRTKDEFLATLAHELRNPLAPIRTALELMKLAGDRPGVHEQARAIMDRQMGQMVRLVDDLLDVSRITSGRIGLRKQPLAIEAPLHNAIESTRSLFDERGHELTLVQPVPRGLVHADPVRMTQVFTNLLGNAAKYTERGGRIRIRVEEEGSEVVVTIEDNGIGIPPERLESVFEMFSQVDSTQDLSRSGLGIGLTLVRRLVEMHGGNIEARSEGRDRGSEFVVRLPLLDETQPLPVESAEQAPAPRSDLSLLVVDDNRDGADCLRMVLETIGNKVATAYDGQEAVEAAERLRPDAVVLDIGLPKLNGYEVARRIREQAWGKNVVLIAVTGWGQEADRRRARDAGIDHHLVKPVDPVELMRILADLPQT